MTLGGAPVVGQAMGRQTLSSHDAVVRNMTSLANLFFSLFPTAADNWGSAKMFPRTKRHVNRRNSLPPQRIKRNRGRGHCFHPSTTANQSRRSRHLCATPSHIFSLGGEQGSRQLTKQAPLVEIDIVDEIAQRRRHGGQDVRLRQIKTKTTCHKKRENMRGTRQLIEREGDAQQNRSRAGLVTQVSENGKMRMKEMEGGSCEN